MHTSKCVPYEQWQHLIELQSHNFRANKELLWPAALFYIWGNKRPQEAVLCPSSPSIFASNRLYDPKHLLTARRKAVGTWSFLLLPVVALLTGVTCRELPSGGRWLSSGLDILQGGSSFQRVVGCSSSSASELSLDRRYISSLLPLVCVVPGIVQGGRPANRPKGCIIGRKSISTELNIHIYTHTRHLCPIPLKKEEARIYDVASFLDS